VTVQAGAYAEHQFQSVEVNRRTVDVNDRAFAVRLAPGAGAALRLSMRRYVSKPTTAFPWDRQ